MSPQDHISVLDVRRDASGTTSPHPAHNMISNTICQHHYTTATTINHHHKTAQTIPPSHSNRHFQAISYFLHVPSRVQQTHFKQKPITSDDVMLDVTSSQALQRVRTTHNSMSSFDMRASLHTVRFKSLNANRALLKTSIKACDTTLTDTEPWSVCVKPPRTISRCSVALPFASSANSFALPSVKPQPPSPTRD